VSNDFAQAEYSENRSHPILAKPDDYDLSVIRFQCPLTNIPIFYFPTLPTFMIALYFETATHGNLYFEKWVNYISYPTLNSKPHSKDPVFFYTDFLTMVNTALLAAANDINTLEPGSITAGEAPYLRKTDSDQNLMELVIPKSLATTLKVYFNTALNDFFESLPNNATVILNNPDGLSPSPGQTAPSAAPAAYIPAPSATQQRCYGYNNAVFNNSQYEIKNCLGWNDGASAYDAFAIVQEFSTLFNWNDALGLVFTTGSIPVLGDQYSIPASTTSGSNITQKVVTDFQLNSTLGPESRSIADYVPFGEYRIMPLTSSTPMNSMDITINWINTSGDIFPLVLSPGANASIKIMYRKKSWRSGDPIVAKYI
jgi:hypothetical protein